MIDRGELNRRLKEAFNLLRYKRLVDTQQDLAVALGMDPRNLNSAFNLVGRAMTKSLLLRVADTFPDVINRRYMETGEGDVALPEPSTRPHVEAEARAGFMVGLSTTSESNENCSLFVYK